MKDFSPHRVAGAGILVSLLIHEFVRLEPTGELRRVL